ncbi:MAG: outer membrane beta-barrel protein [Bacteroidetes bacterium]|nr:outer membrane beta-barrel protein [Bacteroidota bacterium]
MKKLFMMVALSAVTLGINHSATAQVEQGSIIIDPYYGFPNFGKKIADTFVSDSTSDVKVTGIGPCGLRGEYLISDNFGVGFDFIYNSVGAKADYTEIDGAGVSHNYTDDVNMQRFRVQARMNYHFVQTDAVDAYVGFGAGTNIRRYTYDSTNPDFTEPDATTGALIPVSIRIALGTRFYFTDNIGLNAELGLGGPVLSGGISIKF